MLAEDGKIKSSTCLLKGLGPIANLPEKFGKVEEKRNDRAKTGLQHLALHRAQNKNQLVRLCKYVCVCGFDLYCCHGFL